MGDETGEVGCAWCYDVRMRRDVAFVLRYGRSVVELWIWLRFAMWVSFADLYPIVSFDRGESVLGETVTYVACITQLARIDNFAISVRGDQGIESWLKCLLRRIQEQRDRGRKCPPSPSVSQKRNNRLHFPFKSMSDCKG